MWKTSDYSKKEIERAGRIITSSDSNQSSESWKTSLVVIDNWRAAHAFPLNTFAIRLKHLTENYENVIVVQRLKRLESIVEKLKRSPTMSLYRIQDLGGCRAILPDVASVYGVSKKFKESRIRHTLKKENDYIAFPKKSGYRGVHLVYAYNSDKNKKYNKMLIEIQLRTRLQHLWATAVETMGVFTNSALKASQGADELLRFFSLTSSLFALEELCAPVPNTGNSKEEIVGEIIELDKEYRIFETLVAVRKAINITERRTAWKNGYYLLTLNYESHTIRVHYFPKSDFEKATNIYSKVEESKGAQKINTVLTSSTSFDAIIRAYPNYFTDVQEFTKKVKEIMASVAGQI